MKLLHFVKAAEEFAKIIWPIRKRIKVVDLVLRGSVSRKAPNPVDLDMVIIHKNPNLDKFQKLLRDKAYSSHQEEFHDLKRLLKEVDIVELLKGSAIEDLIAKGLFHTSYMNASYFSNQNYRNEWDSENDPKFPGVIFSEGILYNPKTKKFDIPVNTKYSLPEKKTLIRS